MRWKCQGFVVTRGNMACMGLRVMDLVIQWRLTSALLDALTHLQVSQQRKNE